MNPADTVVDDPVVAGQVDAVVFDLDGTLVDTPAAIVSIVRALLARRGIDAEPASLRTIVGRPLPAALAGLLGVADPEGPEVAEALAEYRDGFRAYLAAAGSTLAYPAVLAGLGVLADAGLKLGIATSKPTSAAQRVLDVLGIAELFDVIAGDDAVEVGKPDPALALHVAAGLGVPAHRCVVVGDGELDMRMARAAGMRALGVDYGVGTRSELLAAGATSVLTTFAELVARLLPTGATTTTAKELR